MLKIGALIFFPQSIFIFSNFFEFKAEILVYSVHNIHAHGNGFLFKISIKLYVWLWQVFIHHTSFALCIFLHRNQLRNDSRKIELTKIRIVIIKIYTCNREKCKCKWKGKKNSRITDFFFVYQLNLFSCRCYSCLVMQLTQFKLVLSGLCVLWMCVFFSFFSFYFFFFSILFHSSSFYFFIFILFFFHSKF